MTGRFGMDEPSVVMTRTPLRVSFMGGGSDTKEFYAKEGPGQVISLALDKYIYVIIKRHAKIFEEKYRISYSKNEIVDSIDQIENKVVRECLKLAAIDEPLYVSTFSDIPAASGLGSSSSLTVGLMNALHAMKREPITRSKLAEEACHIEIDRLLGPIGKQDQYTAAFGGLNHFTFNKDESVTVSGLDLSTVYLSNLLSSVSLYWTGLTRQTNDILKAQKENFSKGKLNEVRQISNLVLEFKDLLLRQAGIDELASLVNKSWELKQQFSSTISNEVIDRIFTDLMQSGGLGGKLCGGGGGGFVMMFHSPDRGEELVPCVDSPFQIKLGMDFSGSEVLMVK